MDQNKPSNIGNDLGLRSVLVCRFGALGNVVMTIPDLYSACRCYPEVTFVMLTRSSLTELFVNKPANLVVEGCDLHTRFKSFTSRYSLMAGLCTKYTFDAFIDLQNDSVTRPMRLYCRLHGLKMVKFNNATEHKRALTRRFNKVMLPMVSVGARYREAFFNAGLPVESLFEGVFGADGKSDPGSYARITTLRKAPGHKWIGIAPFAANPQKEYPLEKMTEVIRLLTEAYDCHIYIFGGDGREKERAAMWEEQFGQVTSLAGERHGFPSELALLSHLDVMITMDSANMHLAAIAGTPTISVWGATHYYCGYQGWRQTDTGMVQLPLSCRPCSLSGDKPCYRNDLLCLTAIRPEMIFNKAAEILS